MECMSIVCILEVILWFSAVLYGEFEFCIFSVNYFYGKRIFVNFVEFSMNVLVRKEGGFYRSFFGFLFAEFDLQKIKIKSRPIYIYFFT